MASDMLLYWGSGSGPCWAVMIMLEEKGLQGYKSHQISFSEKGHKGEDVLKINPRGQVPTFKHGDIIVNESVAIVDYLQALYGSTGAQLLPTEPAQLAQVLQRKYEAVNLKKKANEEYILPSFQNKIKDMPEEEVKKKKDNILEEISRWERYLEEVVNLKKKAFEDYLYQIWQKKTEGMSEEELKKKKDDILEEVGRWEGFLEKMGDGAHIAGKDFSIADLVFFPQLAFMVRVGFKLAPRFPRLQAYYDKVSERPSVKASWPPHWKDSPAGTQLADL